MANEEMGMMAHGEFIGFAFQPWNDQNPEKGDHVIFIKVGQRNTEWGGTEDDVIKIRVYGDTALTFYKDKQQQLIGRMVVVPFRVNLKAGTSKRTGNPYAFNEYVMVNNTIARVQPKAQDKAA